MNHDLSTWPKLRPNKPERLVVHCERCQAQLLVKDGKVDQCKCEKGAK